MELMEIIVLSILVALVGGFMINYLFIAPYLQLRKSYKKLQNVDYWLWLWKLGLLDFAEIMEYDRKYLKLKWYS